MNCDQTTQEKTQAECRDQRCTLYRCDDGTAGNLYGDRADADAGVNVELPKAPAEPVDDSDNEPVIVTVDAEGRYYIDIGGDPKVPVSGEEVADRVGKVLASNPKKMLLVRGDRSVNYDQVVQLMVLLQQAGAPAVGLVTE